MPLVIRREPMGEAWTWVAKTWLSDQDLAIEHAEVGSGRSASCH